MPGQLDLIKYKKMAEARAGILPGFSSSFPPSGKYLLKQERSAYLQRQCNGLTLAVAACGLMRYRFRQYV